MEVTLRLNGRDHTLTVVRRGDTIHVTREGVTTEVHIADVAGHAFTLLLEDEVDGRPRRRVVHAAGQAEGDRRQLWVGGQTLAYERVRDDAPASLANDASLAATIPSLVAEVLVAPGDHVAAGDKLLLLESMKMVIPIQAPRDGVIAAVHCAPGDAVAPGVPLVEYAGDVEGLANE